jgi:hypothetical protein
VDDREIPIWPEATVELLWSTVIKYRVDASPRQVAQFYRAQMPLYGWSAADQPLIERGRAVLSFGKAGRIVNCIIEGDHGQRTRVMLALEPVWPAPVDQDAESNTGLVPSGA